MTTVFTNGVFDLLHIGHVHLLEFARAQGDRLVVGINSDSSAKRLKGPSRPIVSAAERAEMLLALRCVDQVEIFEADTPESLIRHLRPDVLVKGPACLGTKVPGAELVQSWGGRVIVPDWPVEQSTTEIADRIRRGDPLSTATAGESLIPGRSNWSTGSLVTQMEGPHESIVRFR